MILSLSRTGKAPVIDLDEAPILAETSQEVIAARDAAPADTEAQVVSVTVGDRTLLEWILGAALNISEQRRVAFSARAYLN